MLEYLDINFFLFFFINLNNSWCKCPLSGWKGFFLNNFFLIIENKFSKAGYHNSNVIKYGDKYKLSLCVWIKKLHKINAIRYAPESPR